MLNTSGNPCSSAASKVLRHYSPSSVGETDQARTERLNQSMTANQVDKARLHPHIGDVATPDLIDPSNRNMTQQAGIDRVFGRAQAGFGLRAKSCRPIARNRRRTRLGLTTYPCVLNHSVILSTP